MYMAVANSNLYHCGATWLVVDEYYNIVSEHTDKSYAEKKSDELNAKQDD